jgi:tetratricopeptide (TPR) repeat protein
VATLTNNLGQVAKVQGRYAEAEPLIRRSLAIREKVLGREHPDVARSLNNLADLYERQRRYAEAQPLFERALAIRERAVGPDIRIPRRRPTIWQHSIRRRDVPATRCRWCSG